MPDKSDPSAIVRLCLARVLATIEAREEELGRLDAAAGDGDHGAAIVRGLRAANQAASQTDAGTAGQLLAQAGSAFADAGGGASGALVGMFLATIGNTLGDGPFDIAHIHAAIRAGMQTICTLGKAKAGDKTMVDALDPFVNRLAQAADSGHGLAAGWQLALEAAEQGVQATKSMIARRGRSSRLGERSLGHADPGATSMLFMLQAAGAVFNESCGA